MRQKRPPLTNKRKDWAEARGAVIKGEPLRYSAAIISDYQRAIQRMTNQMTREYERELRALFNELGPAKVTTDASLASQLRITLNKLSRKYASWFNSEAPKIVNRIFNRIDRDESANLRSSLKKLSGGITLKTDVMPAALKEAMTAATANNVALIKSIPQQYATQIEGAVMRSMQPGGRGIQDVTEALRERKEMTATRIDTIARDQVSKATSTMNTERAQSLGMRKFEWRHSGGGVDQRELHLEYDGQVFSYDDPPIIDERTGERGFPGQAINCRCFAVPVLDFGDEDE